MPSMTVTVTDYTAAGASLADLAFGASTPTGYTVTKSDVEGNIGGNSTGPTSVDYLAIQASYTNGGTKVYEGGSQVANDGTNQARELLAGDIKEYQKGTYPTIVLGQIYVRASASDAIFNVEWQ
jgi:hypothetical protein